MGHHGGIGIAPEVLATGEIASRMEDELRREARLLRQVGAANPNHPSSVTLARQVSRSQDRAEAFAESLGLLVGRSPGDLLNAARNRMLGRVVELAGRQ